LGVGIRGVVGVDVAVRERLVGGRVRIVVIEEGGLG